METDYPVVRISWNDYEQLANDILNKVSGLHIDYVVPVLRGGSVLGLTIANNLNLPMGFLYTRRSATNNPNSDFGEPIFLGEIGLENIKDKTILICEDIIDTELTIKDVLCQIKRYNPKKIIISTLYNFSKNDAYYSGCMSKHHYWVIFPWERIMHENN